MAEHALKTWPNAFEAIADGRKRFEWRKDDRGFEVGDVLLLRKWNPDNLGGYDIKPSGKHVELRCRVTYILRGLFEVPPGYCVMSIEMERP